MSGTETSLLAAMVCCVEWQDGFNAAKEESAEPSSNPFMEEDSVSYAMWEHGRSTYFAMVRFEEIMEMANKMVDLFNAPGVGGIN